MMLRRIRSKRAAIELSMTTIIVVVLSLTLLIMGFVFVRSIMCGAIGVTEEIGDKVENEVQRLFESSAGEISCIGSEDPVPMTPGTNNVFCAINAKSEGRYIVTVDSIEALDGIPPTTNLQSWIIDDQFNKVISPGDDTPQKVITLNIPENAPEGTIRIEIDATKDGEIISGQKRLDFRVTRTGVVRNILC